MQIILDISANTHKNNMKYAMKMIDTIGELPRGKHEILIKGQLFHKAGDNLKQDEKVFSHMMIRAAVHGLKMTASVFDIDSLAFLLQFNVPFIKIANNPEYEWLVGEIPRRIPVYQSVPPELYWSGEIGDAAFRWHGSKLLYMLCVSKYPAEVDDYGSGPGGTTAYALSDHTIGTELLMYHEPKIWEKHFKLEDSTGLDAGDWAITPEQLKEVLENVSW